MSNNEIAITNAAAKLNKSLAKSSLDDLVKARTRRSLLLVDCSGSMVDTIRTGERKIDALRKVVDTLRETHPVPVAAFGLRGSNPVEVVDNVPEPAGGTPLDLAIDFGAAQGATHLVVVTDGQPNSEDAAFQAAIRFGGQIDVFYIGDGNDYGSVFAQRLAKLTGGTCGVTDLVGESKVLAGKIMLALGDGSETI
jgi:hypothetical protein